MASLISHKVLAPEIWFMVLDCFREYRSPKDLTWLWLGGRHVSQLFRYEIENIFQTIHLPDTVLHCRLGKLAKEKPHSTI